MYIAIKQLAGEFGLFTKFKLITVDSALKICKRGGSMRVQKACRTEPIWRNSGKSLQPTKPRVKTENLPMRQHMVAKKIYFMKTLQELLVN